MKNLSLLSLPFLFLLLVASTCTGSEPVEIGLNMEMTDAASRKALLTSEAADYEQSAYGNVDDVVPVTEKKLIRTGYLSFQSKNTQKDYEAIKALLKGNEAYVENESENRGDYRLDYYLTIRVPSQNFDALLESIAGIAYRIQTKSTNVQDISESYADLDARIKNKKALESRYIELLTKAKDIKEILEVERNLNQVRYEIENMEGQLKSYDRQVSYSTLNVSFFETLPYSIEPDGRSGFFARILNSFKSGWQYMLNFVLGLITLWPFILAGIFILLGVKRLRKRNV